MQREAYGFGLVLLATLDKNKDAVLSETEIARMKEALLTLDENQDGEVSRAELTAAMPAAMAALHGNQEDQPQWDGFRDRWRRWHRRHDNPSDHGDQPGSEEAREPWREARWEAGTRRSEAPWDHGGRSRPAEPSQ